MQRLSCVCDQYAVWVHTLRSVATYLVTFSMSDTLLEDPVPSSYQKAW